MTCLKCCPGSSFGSFQSYISPSTSSLRMWLSFYGYVILRQPYFSVCLRLLWHVMATKSRKMSLQDPKLLKKSILTAVYASQKLFSRMKIVITAPIVRADGATFATCQSSINQFSSVLYQMNAHHSSLRVCAMSSIGADTPLTSKARECHAQDVCTTCWFI